MESKESTSHVFNCSSTSPSIASVAVPRDVDEGRGGPHLEKAIEKDGSKATAARKLKYIGFFCLLQSLQIILSAATHTWVEKSKKLPGRF